MITSFLSYVMPPQTQLAPQYSLLNSSIFAYDAHDYEGKKRG